MSSGWIVSCHDFVVHRTPETAFKEMARLTEKTEGKKKFRVMRVKNCGVQQQESLITSSEPPSNEGVIVQ